MGNQIKIDLDKLQTALDDIPAANLANTIDLLEIFIKGVNLGRKQAEQKAG